MTKKAISLLVIFAFPLVVFGQTRKVFEKAANKALLNKDYYSSMVFYKKAVKKDTTRLKNVYKAGESARLFSAYEVAERYYEMVVLQDSTYQYKDAAYWLGSVKNSLGKYTEADSHFKNWLKRNKPTDSLYQFAELFLKHNRWAISNPTYDETVTIENLGESVNSISSDFAPQLIDDRLYYSSLRYLHQEDKENPKRYFTKVMLSEDGMDGVKLDAPFNIDPGKHSGNMMITDDGQMAYFTLCDYGDDGLTNCQIYSATKNTDNSWSSATRLSEVINSGTANVTHPFVGLMDGKEKIFFSSNRPGGQGGMDIWCADIQGNNTFGQPKNLEAINTNLDEITPFFVDGANILFFSSDGYPGYGGFDVLKSTKTASGWQTPVNLKQPINSSFHDTYFKLYDNGTKGLFASNRLTSEVIDQESGACCHDIYLANIIIEVRMIANTLNQLSKEMLHGVQVQLVNLTDGTIDTVAMQVDGSRYFFPLQLGKEYQVIAMKDGFIGDTVLVSTMNIVESTTIEKDLHLEPKLELMAYTFDEVTNTPLPGATVRLIRLDDDKSEDKYNEEKNDFSFYIDYGYDYMLIANRDGFSSDTVRFTTKDLPFESKKITKKLFLEKDEGIYAVLPVYFHNDEPNPNSLREKSTVDYNWSYDRYVKMEEMYKRKFSAGKSGNEKQSAEQKVERFFEQEVLNGYNSLIRFSNRLKKILDRNRNVEIVIKGFASPLAPTDYNKALTKRRIDNVEQFLKHHNTGLLAPYFEQGRIIVTVEPYGEEKAAQDVSDSSRDRQNSVFSPKASRERRVEILQIRSFPNNLPQ